MWRSKRCRRTTARRGVDHVSTEQYGANLDVNLVRLGEALRTDSYRPQSIRRHDIPKHVLGPAFGRTRGPGSQEKRPLGIPTVQDRVVQTALRMVIEPIFERDFAAQSYGFRPGRGCKEALRRVDELLKSHPCGRCRSEKLPPGQARGHASHDPEGPSAGPCGQQRACPREGGGGRSTHPVPGPGVPGAGCPGRYRGMGSGTGHTSGGGDQSAAEQHLPRSAGSQNVVTRTSGKLLPNPGTSVTAHWSICSCAQSKFGRRTIKGTFQRTIGENHFPYLTIGAQIR
jgi:hypothetical protein